MSEIVSTGKLLFCVSILVMSLGRKEKKIARRSSSKKKQNPQKQAACMPYCLESLKSHFVYTFFLFYLYFNTIASANLLTICMIFGVSIIIINIDIRIRLTYDNNNNDSYYRGVCDMRTKQNCVCNILCA